MDFISTQNFIMIILSEILKKIYIYIFRGEICSSLVPAQGSYRFGHESEIIICPEKTSKRLPFFLNEIIRAYYRAPY